MEIGKFSVCTKAFSRNSLRYVAQSLQNTGWKKCILWGGITQICPEYGNERMWADNAKVFWNLGVEIPTFYPEIVGYGYNPASIDRNTQKRTRDYLMRAIACCKAVGAENILLHPGMAFENENQRNALQRAAECYGPVLEQVLAAGITPIMMHRGIRLVVGEGNELCSCFGEKQREIGFSISADEILESDGSLAEFSNHTEIKQIVQLILFDGPGGHLVLGDGKWDVRRLVADWWDIYGQTAITIQFDDRRYVMDAQDALRATARRIAAW